MREPPVLPRATAAFQGGGAAPLDHLLRRDRQVAIAALAAVIILAWAHVLHGAGMDMGEAMAGAAAPMAWSPAHAAVVALMWALMMLAMMLPSAAPMILLHATVSRRRDPARGGLRALLFALGYAAAWTGFALAATAVQWGLERAALLTPAMATGSAVLASLLFLGAGIYQFTPLKRACLRHCRSPLEFLAGHWRAGAAGAFAMGGRHGAYCIGCCWAAMALLFAGGVMNLAWIAGLALLVLAEKLLPGGPLAGRVVGATLILWGAAGLAMAAG
jgi:predicted metal-binding membrane protein